MTAETETTEQPAPEPQPQDFPDFGIRCQYPPAGSCTTPFPFDPHDTFRERRYLALAGMWTCEGGIWQCPEHSAYKPWWAGWDARWSATANCPCGMNCWAQGKWLGRKAPNGDAGSTKEPTMLVLSRQRDESIIIGDNVVVTIVDIRGDKVRLGVEAPKEVPVHRREVFDAIHRNDAAAGGGSE